MVTSKRIYALLDALEDAETKVGDYHDLMVALDRERAPALHSARMVSLCDCGIAKVYQDIRAALCDWRGEQVNP